MEEVDMEKSNVETLFVWLDELTELFQLHNDEPYLESLVDTLETLFYRETAEYMDDILAHKVQTLLKDINLASFATGDIRKAVQLAILKGMKDTTQPHHLMTPEAVSLFISYLAEKITIKKENIRVFDPACGTGNLLTAVLGQLSRYEAAFGSEVDATLIKLALLSANLQKKQIEFFHQDSLRPLLIDPVDLVVADLPVGYYPDDIGANNFELKAESGHSYSHHLFIEQSLKYTKEDGYLIFLIPEFLFESDQAEQLRKFLKKSAHIIGVIRLPDSAFKSRQHIKSILILQKQGESQAPKQPLLVNLPSFTNTIAMEDILDQMNQWFKTYHGK